MVDHVDAERRSNIMRAVRTQHTGPEKVVRSLLHRLGYRFRLHRKDLPGSPDIVLPRYKLAIFVHGCFWHAHACPKGRAPNTRREYWLPKLEANRSRDRRNVAALIEAGWRVEVIWQCELVDTAKLTVRLQNLLRAEPKIV